MVGTMLGKSLENFIADDMLAFAFFFVPFVNFFPVACGAIVFFSLISIGISVVRRENVDLCKVNMVSVAVLVFMLVTALFSIPVVEDMKQFSRLEFQLRLPMLLFPAAFLFRGFAKFDVRRAMISFALGAFATSLVVLIVFSHSLFTAFENIPHSFFNVQLCFQCVVGLITHRTYMCFNLITGLLIFYCLFSESWNMRRLFLFFPIFLFTGAFVFMSDARVSLVTFLWVFFAIFVREYRKRVKGWRFYASLFAIVMLLFYVLMRSERINNIIINLFSFSLPYQDLDPRFRIWHCGWLLFKESPHQLIGTGTGSLMGSLPKIYEQDGFLQGIESRWEMHNQFLEVLVENGVWGLSLLLFMLLLPLFLKSSRRLFYLIWIPVLGINLFFESMLSRSFGTYPVMAVLVLGGMLDDRGSVPIGSMKRKIALVLYLVSILSLSVKFIMMDKRAEFGSFQRFFERVDILPGDVPEDLKGQYGLKIDSSTSSETWREYATMYHRFGRYSLRETDSVRFSVYVYASEDFNADILSLRIEERQSSSREVFYDFTRKGTWQKLQINDTELKGNSVFLITAAKKDSHNFEDVKGCAIFAKPIIEIK